MRLVITSEHRFSISPDGTVWSRVGNDFAFWQRYQAAFDSIRVVARGKPDRGIDNSFKIVTGPGVEFWPLPSYCGPTEFALCKHRLARSIHDSLGPADAVLCRVPSPIATELLRQIKGRPYGLEVIGDPYEALGPGAVRHPFRPFFRRVMRRQLRQQCAHAVGVGYVTRAVLQQRYPCPAHTVGISDVSGLDFSASPKAFTTNYSSVACREEDFRKESRHFQSGRACKVLFVGSLAQMYKGPDILLHAVANFRSDSFLEVVIVGDGKHRPELQDLANKLGIGPHVNFLGELPSGLAVQQQMDAATLLVTPSRTEGLPRALIEAMARALPCIGSKVGGIPELLDERDMVPAGDVDALAEKLREVLSSPERLTEMSGRNLARAQEYRPDVLDKRRGEFYQFLRKTTQQWLANN